ncbi:WXG100 family type VII secretion target [Amycolatopsis sp. YIM 10]|uniref:WXG100 family type VII secretion target n=1 Tax=Amycolatopsis sp. YIM 10 TaxID=2653857 RepID=UPI001290737E|nr:type VII secretion target [Amycolatopsis sp. YIM 10]QFU87209.1 hypothetical protein YIM_10015 [Amycolatopsis sp. YIM 10]
MDGYQVDPEKLQGAADAIGRGSEHLGSMAEYCASLSSSADGAEFGELLAKFREGYDAAAETQVTVLKDMQEKLGLTRDALETTKAAYETTDSTFGTSIGDFLGEINSPVGTEVVR